MKFHFLHIAITLLPVSPPEQSPARRGASAHLAVAATALRLLAPRDQTDDILLELRVLVVGETVKHVVVARRVYRLFP